MLSEVERRLARLSVARRVLTENQLSSCLQRRKDSGLPLERILEDAGLLTAEEIEELVRLSRELPSRPPMFAELAREEGMAGPRDIEDALAIKARLASRNIHRPIGEILVDRKVLSPGQVDELLSRQGKAARCCAVCGYRFNVLNDRSLPCPECGIESSGTTPPGGTPPYVIAEELGRGPHGVVFRALPAEGGAEVAFKRLHAPRRPDAALLRVPDFSHPNVAGVHAVGTYEKSAWIASELVHGVPLLDHVLGSVRLPGEEAILILKQIAAVLAAAHARGILHGGLRAQNVFVTETREIKVTDFAVARPGAPPPELLPWWAPERGSCALAPAADLYACGVLGYFMLSGRLPFEGTSAEEIRHLQLTRRVPLLAALAPDLPPGTDSVLQKLVHRDPALRYRDAGALLRDLDLLENGQPPEALKELLPRPARPPEPPQAPPRLRPRRR